MSVLRINRMQELLRTAHAYTSIIRHAAPCHKGTGWCIYDVMFRRKAIFLAKTDNESAFRLIPVHATIMNFLVCIGSPQYAWCMLKYFL